MTLRKLVRYSIASTFGTVVGLGTLYLLVARAKWAGVPANITAVTLGAIPNYIVNRYWTWQKRGRSSLTGEVLPFWLLALIGLGISTLFVHYADQRWGTPAAILLANITGFAVVWTAKFAVLDRVLFAPARND